MSIEDMIDAAANDDVLGFKKAFNSAVMAKLGDAIETKRIDVASKLYAEPEDEEADEEEDLDSHNEDEEDEDV